jgi:hypothetical protein
MPTPQNIERIAAIIISTPITQNDRAELSTYLTTIEAKDELFARCIKKACVNLERYNDSDIVWLHKWLPIILRTINETKNQETAP